jgi:carbon starvation protein
MLIESLLAVIALITVGMLSPDQLQDKMHHGAVPIFANGIGGFITITGCSLAAGVTFASVSVAEFALTSLDTATRIGRFAFQELVLPGPSAAGSAARLMARFSRNRFLTTAVTVAAGGALALSGTERSIWPVFGAANQMLAAMAFLAVLVWLTYRGQKAMYILVPTLFMFIVTLSALVFMTVGFFRKGNWLLAAISLLLALLALVLVGEAVKSVRRTRGAAGATPADRMAEASEPALEPDVAPVDGGRPGGR